MTRGEAWLNHAASLLVGGTGVVYAWARYVAEPLDEFSLVHPWEPHAQHLHVLVAPLLVFAAGAVWTRHAWARVRSGYRTRRSSGLALVASLAPMIASGYLLQVSVGEGWRTAWAWVHGAASVVWVLAYATHLVQRASAPASRADLGR